MKIGGSRLLTIAGPCTIENLETLSDVAREVRKSGALGLRGGHLSRAPRHIASKGWVSKGLNSLRRWEMSWG